MKAKGASVDLEPSIDLVIGYPGSVARRTIGLCAKRGRQVTILARAQARDRIEAMASSLPPGVRILYGDPAAVDLGLPAADISRISRHVRVLYLLEESWGKEHARPLNTIRESVALARESGPPGRLVFLAPPAERPPTQRSGVSHAMAPARQVSAPEELERMVRARAEGLEWTILRTGMAVDSAPEAKGTAGESLVKILTLLHCCLDIRRLRPVASRRLVLTSADLAARVADMGGQGGLGEVGWADLRDPRPPTLADVDTALSSMVDSARSAGADLRAGCRRHKRRLLDRWIGAADPVDVLAMATTESHEAGSGDRLARSLGLEWMPTLEVLHSCMDQVVESLRRDIAAEAETEDRDALLT